MEVMWWSCATHDYNMVLWSHLPGDFDLSKYNIHHKLILRVKCYLVHVKYWRQWICPPEIVSYLHNDKK